MSTAPKAAQDLQYIRGLIERTDRRIDPHAFHYVHWGAIVLVWYPLAKWFEIHGNAAAMAWVGLAAVALGTTLSLVREMRLREAPRLEAENTYVSTQIMLATFVSIGGGVFLSAFSPAFGFIDGPNIPTLWGLVYATMASMIGIVYRRAFLYAGAFIFLASLVAIALPQWNGFIVGPAMGLGMIIPGIQAERRVQQMRTESA